MHTTHTHVGSYLCRGQTCPFGTTNRFISCGGGGGLFKRIYANETSLRADISTSGHQQTNTEYSKGKVQ